MGNRVPKEQSLSEKTKQTYLTFAALHKSGDISESQHLIYNSPSTLCVFTLHQSVLSTSNLTMPLNDNFLIISRSQPMLEVTFLDLQNRSLHVLKFDSPANFQTITSQLFLSKRPYWTLSEVCQDCSQDFGFFKRCHHCRGCGKSICSNCSKDIRMDIYGYIDRQRACQGCVGKVAKMVEVVSDLRKTDFQSSVHENLYNLPHNSSLIELNN